MHSDLVRQVKDILQKQFEPQGFNIGVNCGEAAGQTVFHAHIHIIPRYTGDVPSPRGGVRQHHSRQRKLLDHHGSLHFHAL